MSLLIHLLITLTISCTFAQTKKETLSSEADLSFTNCSHVIDPKTKKYTYKKNCLQAYLDSHPFFTVDFSPWKSSISKPVNNRVITANQSITEFLMVDSLIYGGKAKGVSGVEDPEALSYAQDALSNLPKEIKKYISQHFYGFILVKGVDYTGFAPKISSTPTSLLKTGGIIIVNVDNLRDSSSGQLKTANDWFTFKEKTVFQHYDKTFQSQKTHTIHLSLNNPAGKSTQRDLFNQFLLHEMAHVIAASDPTIHPDFKYKSGEAPLNEYKKVNSNHPLKAFSFLETSWNKTIDINQRGKDIVKLTRKSTPTLQNLIDQKPIQFYTAEFEKKYTIQEAKTLYSELQKTCFVSLYAMRDYTEDFAETLSQYFLKKQGYQAFQANLISLDNRTIEAQFTTDIWSRPECSAKKEFIENFFQ